MASNADFVQYIVDQCSGAGEISVKKMMGDYCIYCDGAIFGLICDNNLYVKVTEPGRAVLKEVFLRPPYDGAKDYFYVSDVDDRDYLTALIKATIPALPKPKPKKNPMKTYFWTGSHLQRTGETMAPSFLRSAKALSTSLRSRPVISAILPAFTGAPNSRMALSTCSFMAYIIAIKKFS